MSGLVSSPKKDMAMLSLKKVSAVAAMCAAAAFALSCEGEESGGEKGELVIRFAEGQFPTKSGEKIPDPDKFILDVKDGDGGTVYSGSFGNMPEHIAVAPGIYDISVRSGEFDKPEFAAPLYGDDQSIVVPSGGREEVRLVCTQLNSGVKLKVGADFLENYPEAVLFLTSSEGRLMYSYSEKRIAYFKPGTVSLLMDDGGRRRNLLTRRLEPKEMLQVRIGAPSSVPGGLGGIDVSVDTSRTWSGADVVIGEDNEAGGKGSQGKDGYEDAADVTSAGKIAGAKGVWVYGYITGAFKSTNRPVFKAPFSSTNIAISRKKSASDRKDCFSVELKKGKIRDALNLAANPDIIGSKVYLKGDVVETYYGVPGMKNVTDYVLE